MYIVHEYKIYNKYIYKVERLPLIKQTNSKQTIAIL